ncbi:MAG: alpha/beta hydrolase [Pseudolysinimonas sp.]
MPIDPWLAERFELIRDIPSFDAALADPRYGEPLMRYLEDPEPWTPPAGIVTEDQSVDGLAGSIPIRVFRPVTPGAEPAPGLLWMHGGGFVMGTIDDTESMIPGYELAARAGAVVVSVGYRLALDGIRYPAPLDDVMAAWRFVVGNTGQFGIDPAALFIGGASVGANLATGAAVRLREAGEPVPRGMLLAYPLEHFPTPPADPGVLAELEQVPPMLRFPEQYQLGIVHNYLGRVTDLPAEVVPGNFPVDGLPEAWIAPSEYDDLRPSGELFATQLVDAGIPAHLEVARGMVHGHLGRGPSLAGVAATLDFFAGALRDASANGGRSSGSSGH